jgi:hypothetical protein
MKRGLQQALIYLIVGVGFASAAAGVWSAVKDDGFRVPLAVSLMVVAALLSLTGSNAISRAGSMDAFAFLGKGPEYEGKDEGEGLTSIGVFLFVALPMFVAGGLLYGTG